MKYGVYVYGEIKGKALYSYNKIVARNLQYQPLVLQGDMNGLADIIRHYIFIVIMQRHVVYLFKNVKYYLLIRDGSHQCRRINSTMSTKLSNDTRIMAAAGLFTSSSQTIY